TGIRSRSRRESQARKRASGGTGATATTTTAARAVGRTASEGEGHNRRIAAAGRRRRNADVNGAADSGALIGHGAVHAVGAAVQIDNIGRGIKTAIVIADPAETAAILAVELE